MSRWRKRVLVLLVGLSAAGAVLGVAVRGLGRWLVVADPLARGRAVVVLTGDFPFRAMEAAAIHLEGWASEVWLQRATAPAREAALARLGLPALGEERSNVVVLERLGVPPGRIRILPGRARNTAEEVQLIVAELGRVGGEAVIVVTSKPHTRRVRMTWKALVGDRPALVVRYAREDPFEPAAWWRDTRDALAVSREVLGLLNLWAGFPVRPGRGVSPS